MKLFELYSIRKSMILKESIKLCKSVITLLEAEGFDWEPQPEFRGKGETGETGFGMKSSRDAQQKAGNQKLNVTWQKLISRAKSMSGIEREKLKPHLAKVAAEAAKRGFTLSPNPKETLGL